MDLTAICNLALQGIGTRTTVTSAELTNNSTNEAIQFNLSYALNRDKLLRMSPWACATATEDLTYITSLPGTPENQSAAPSQAQWQPGLPIPPWTYEYQYPVDCLRALRIVSSFSTGIQGPPIYPTSTMTGYSPQVGGPPLRFDVGIDKLWNAPSIAIVLGGSGYVANEVITLAIGAVTSAPIGAPAQIQVDTVDGAGAILTAHVVNSIPQSGPTAGTTGGGAYFQRQTTTSTQGSTTGVGVGATFNLNSQAQLNQRVILTNQEFAVLGMIRQITDPNTMDPLFQGAWIDIMSATLCMALTGDKQLANGKISLANQAIAEARAADANESLTINDVTPDWLRIRGVIYSDSWTGSSGFDWGGEWQTY